MIVPLVNVQIGPRMKAPCAPQKVSPRVRKHSGDVTDFEGVDMCRIPIRVPRRIVSGVYR